MSISDIIKKIDKRLDELSQEYVILTDFEQVGPLPRRVEARVANLGDMIDRYKRMRARYSRIRAQSRFEFNRKIYQLPEDVQRHIRGFVGK